MLKHNIIFEPFSDWRFQIAKAEDSYIWDTAGQRMIDFTSGWNVTNLGWNNPEIKEAAIKQLEKNAYAPMWSHDQVQADYANALVAALPEHLCAIGRATGGTEANEEAIKTAKAFTGRRKILSFRKTYHGQSQTTLALGDDSTEAKRRGFVHIDFPALDEGKDADTLLKDFAHALEEVLSPSDIAAIVTEAGIITGWGSARIAPHGFLKTMQSIAQKYGTLIILDEVGTGFSRCGTLFGLEQEDFVPDIVTFAKAATNGMGVLGSMVTTREIAERTLDKSNLISTFGWTPAACAVALKTLEIHQRDRTWEMSKEHGFYLLQTLQQQLASLPVVTSISGKGLLLGMHFAFQEENTMINEIVRKAHQSGLHLVSDKQSTIQLMPPITTTKEVLDEGIEILVATIKAVSNL